MPLTLCLPVCRLWVTLAIGIALGGCGGGGDDPSGAADASGSASMATLLVMSTEPAGSNCVNSGTRVTAGLDANGDALLSANEISAVQYLCNGVDGAAGSAGSTGPSGPAGAAGPVGATGSSGVASLLAIVPEPAGPHCAAGGSKVTAGSDTDRSGVLDVSEVVTTGYVCNGAAGASNWVEVTALTAAAQANTGYLANNAAQVVVTLPAAPNIGDVVQVTGLGTGGWKIAQQAGQTILAQALAGGTKGTPRADARSWSAMASSADGTRLVAAAGYSPIHTSADSGVTWVARATANVSWGAVASSADGMVLAAVANDGTLITSTDAGVTWTTRVITPTPLWAGVAMSADGTKMVAVAYGTMMGGVVTYGAQIYTSTDSGSTWTTRDTARIWVSVASSADGNLLVAAESNGLLYTSSDSGLTWTGRAASRNWIHVASSADGSKLLAAVNNGSLYTSTDAGATWTAREASREWRSVSSSADGIRLWAASNGFSNDGALYSSADGGATWSSRESGLNWTTVTTNATGTRVVAGVHSGNLYTFSTRTSMGTAGSVSGAQYDSIALQYVGGGIFLPISSVKYSGVFVVE